MESTREWTSPLLDTNNVVNNSKVNDDLSIDDNKDSNIAADISKTESNSNVNSLDTRTIDKLTNSSTFKEDKETQVVDKTTLSLE